MVFGLHPGRPGRSGRRVRLRRKLPRQTSPVLAWLRDERNLSAVLVVAAFVAAATMLAAWADGLPREYAGQRATTSRVNRIEYSDVDEAATERRREEARKAAPLVFAASTDYLQRMQGEIEGLPLLVRDKLSLAEVPESVPECVPECIAQSVCKSHSDRSCPVRRRTAWTRSDTGEQPHRSELERRQRRDRL